MGKSHMTQYKTTQNFALAQDEADSLKSYREQFHIPKQPDGKDVVYFAGHSLGLQPLPIRGSLRQQQIQDHQPSLELRKTH